MGEDQDRSVHAAGGLEVGRQSPPFTLPPLPYSEEALAPHISGESLRYHHGRHHQGYVTKLNQLVEEDRKLKGKSLELLIASTDGPVFDNAAQVWNHSFYWTSMTPRGGGVPEGRMLDAIKNAFGTFHAFQERFEKVAESHFGSGWVWLVRGRSGALEIVDTHDADSPLTRGLRPLLTCDVWEHAYYVDYRNERAHYLHAWWNVVDWGFAAQNLAA